MTDSSHLIEADQSSLAWRQQRPDAMQTRSLGTTEVVTSSIGLGCASLFRLPRPADRLTILQTAFSEGIRHFDVAPIYGFGLAEAELGSFLHGRRQEATVATKFGIDPTALGRVAARLQGPVRASLRRLPHVAGAMKSSASGPHSGMLGRVLYASEIATAEAARRSLERSLSALRTDYIDIFMVHDPTCPGLQNGPELIDYLETEVTRGRIRTWGATSAINAPGGAAQVFLRASPVLQVRDDIFERSPREHIALFQGLITFGIMERALPALTAFFERPDSTPGTWSARFGFDVRGRDELPRLLIREALRRNSAGLVLFSSTRTDRVRAAINQVDALKEALAAKHESDVLVELTAAVDRVARRTVAE